MARRVLIAGGIGLGLILLINIIVLTIYLPRMMRPPASSSTNTASSATNAATSPTNTATSGSVATTSAPSTGASPVKHLPRPEGDVVQRSEVSPSGNIRVKYTRRKGGPIRQIILEPATGSPADSKVLFEHQRNAWVVFSPNDEWIALNNRPNPGESHLQLYHHDGNGPLDYSVAQDVAVDGVPLEEAVWKSYVETMGLPPDTARDAATIDAVRWENDSTLTMSVAVTPVADDDKVPPPWTCTFNTETKQIEASEETAQAVAQEEGLTTGLTSANSADTTSKSENLLEGNFPGERFPATRLRILEDDEVATWPGENVRYAINELYARRGYDFNDNPDQRRLFAKMSWYRPHLGSMDEIEKGFSEVEKHNIELLAKYRSTKQSRRRQAKSSRSEESSTPGPGQQFWQAIKDGWRPPHP